MINSQKRDDNFIRLKVDLHATKTSGSVKKKSWVSQCNHHSSKFKHVQHSTYITVLFLNSHSNPQQKLWVGLPSGWSTHTWPYRCLLFKDHRLHISVQSSLSYCTLVFLPCTENAVQTFIKMMLLTWMNEQQQNGKQIFWRRENHHWIMTQILVIHEKRQKDST